MKPAILALCILATPAAAMDFWHDAFSPRYLRQLEREHARWLVFHAAPCGVRYTVVDGQWHARGASLVERSEKR